ncbi:MAG: Ni/Fe hydrogenase subunit alpha [Desulfomonilaceae bacterium]|nr:Ni/Fe hydrogenase subunit alpha [Desulfomonilaceae bacterium]
MVRDAKINVHHLTRVEGHGDIVAEIRDGRLEDVKFAVVEAPRFFECFLQGHSYEEVVHIAPRICGICSVSHKSAALKATESALSVEVSRQTRLLRLLAFNGEVIGSHILHAYFLALPDFFDAPSVFPLVQTHKDSVLRGMRLKRLGYDICEVVAGRHTHPVGMIVGGFTCVHSEDDLIALRERIVQGLEDMKETVRLYKSITIPQFERETEYVSLTHPDRYPFYEGAIHSSEGRTISTSDYRTAIREYVVPHSTAKHAKWNRREYMVGALARVNNNFKLLSPTARQAARDLGLEVPCHNPFMNTVAQVVESMHCLEDCVDLIDEMLSHGLVARDESVRVVPRAGVGIGVVEAPRGILFHEYGYDDDGVCIAANHVIPTAQNLANLEADMREYVPQILHGTEEHITHQLEMLVRAYDPCISCSTHVVHLTVR